MPKNGLKKLTFLLFSLVVAISFVPVISVVVSPNAEADSYKKPPQQIKKKAVVKKPAKNQKKIKSKKTSKEGVSIGVKKVKKNIVKFGDKAKGKLDQLRLRVSKGIVYGPHTKIGPLGDPRNKKSVASTFRSGTYTMKRLNKETVMYRVYGGSARPHGDYLTQTRPKGALQATTDSALRKKWGNSASRVATIKVPKGTIIYEGVAAKQEGKSAHYWGGGNQVYIKGVKPEWVVKKERF